MSAADPDQLQRLRRQFVEFLSGSQRCYRLKLDVAAKQRIDFVYSIVFPGWRRFRFYWNFFLARIAQAIDCPPLKAWLYRRIGMQIGSGVFISPEVFLDPHFPELIRLEDYAILGWGVKIFTHEASTSRYRVGRVTVGTGAVIGADSVIRSGVAVGAGADVAYGSVVYTDVPSNCRLGLRRDLAARPRLLDTGAGRAR